MPGTNCSPQNPVIVVLAEPIVVLDLETTGLRCDQGDRVTEIAALRVHGERVVERFETLVNCRLRLPNYISRFTGITQAMVDGAPPASKAFGDLLSFIGTDTVVAHNAAFDQAFLASECHRERLTGIDSDFVCSLQMARRLFPDMKSHALGCLASRLGIKLDSALHRAGVDAELTARILLHVAKTLQTKYSVPVVTAQVLKTFAYAAVELDAASAA